MAEKVLVVEDEPAVLDLLVSWLEDAGYETHGAGDGVAGLRGLYEFRPDLIVADILMPHMDGFEFCRLAREVCNAPIMILSGLGDEADKVKGLNLGADEYVVKPVPMNEFMARVGALLRRNALNNQNDTAENRYEDGFLTLDNDRNEVWVKKEMVQLTPTEFRLLSLLTEEAGRTCSTRQVLDRVWDDSHYSPDLVKWHIASLRGKIENEPSDPRRIVTVWGVGYRYDPLPTPDSAFQDKRSGA